MNILKSFYKKCKYLCNMIRIYTLNLISKNKNCNDINEDIWVKV